jgi:hypothetical protein
VGKKLMAGKKLTLPSNGRRVEAGKKRKKWEKSEKEVWT